MPSLATIQHGRHLRQQIAHLILSRGMVIKGAAYHLGIKESTAEYHLARARAQIHRSTASLLGSSFIIHPS